MDTSNNIMVMDTFIDDTKTTIPQWAVFGAIRSLYENEIDHYATIDTSRTPTLTNIMDFRNFALSKQGYNTNILYYYEKIPISQELWNLLMKYKNTVVNTVPVKQFESYILLTMYPKMLLKENVKFIITDYINFTSLVHFLELLNLMQHNKFTLSHIKQLFKNVLYNEIVQELLGKKYTYNLILNKQTYPLTKTLNERSVERIIQSLINDNTSTIQLSNSLNLPASIKLVIETYLNTLKLQHQDDLVDKIVNYSMYTNLKKIPSISEIIELNVELYVISKGNKKIDNLKKIASTLILDKVMTLPVLIRNTQLLILLKKMEPNVKKQTFYSNLIKILCNQNVGKMPKLLNLSGLISNKRELDDEDI